MKTLGRNPFVVNTTQTQGAMIVTKTTFKMDSQPFKSKSRMTYSISDLLSFRNNAVEFVLPTEAQRAFSERNTVPYKTPMKRTHVKCEEDVAEEEDQHKIENRMKQIGFGKLTEGYINYTKFVPVCRRVRGDPRTPDPHQICSKRSWDGQIKKWRRALHAFDDVTSQEDLLQVRKNLVIINATPNKQKVRTPMTEPIRRNEQPKPYILRGKTLNFDDDD